MSDPNTVPVLRRLPVQARRLGWHPDRLRDYVKAGRIRYHRDGPRGWIYLADADLAEFLATLQGGGDRDAA